VLGVGLLLVILNGLFPPYGVDARSVFSLSQEHYGYRFLFAPPVNSKIIITTFFVQFVTIVGATAGAFFLFDSRGRIYSLANHVEH
jgi:hypothetical protein